MLSFLVKFGSPALLVINILHSEWHQHHHAIVNLRFHGIHPAPSHRPCPSIFQIAKVTKILNQRNTHCYTIALVTSHKTSESREERTVGDGSDDPETPRLVWRSRPRIERVNSFGEDARSEEECQKKEEKPIFFGHGCPLRRQ